MSEREDITTIRHFVYKAGKWNDSAEEYANDTGVYDALDRIETALAARDAGAEVREDGFGPRVTVRRSCDDCKACVTESYIVQSDSGQKVRCAHPSLAKPKYIGDTSWETPQWCPALVDAEARDAGAVTDTQRIDWLADQPVFDNIGNYPLDVYELSCVVAEQRGRMEPNADDQREAFRRLIDAALVDVVSRALARDGGDADAQ